MIKKKVFSSKEELLQTIKIGTIYTTVVDDVNIAITQTKSGFYAFKDQCPHNKVKLSNGKCNIHDEIVCPWHNYRFKLQTGDEQTNHGLFLMTYNLEINDDGVYLIL